MANFSVDPSVPQDTEAETLGASRIRALASAINQLFGQSAVALYTFLQSPFGLDAAGLPTAPANPTAALGLATKQYVDGQVVGATIPQGALVGGPTAYTVVLNPAPASLAALLDKLIEVSANVSNAAGPVTIAPNGFAATTVKKWVNGTLVDLAANDFIGTARLLLLYDGAVFQLVGVSNQIQAVGLAGARNLYASSAGGNTTLNFTADLVVTRNNTLGTLAFFNTFNATVDISQAGPVLNGRDQAAAFAATAVVHVYAISGAGQTVGLIASLTAPSGGGPTLPANYTHWAYLTTLILSGSTFQNCQIVGDKVYYAARQATSLVGGQASVETAVSLTNWVPPIAQAVFLQIEGSVTTSAGVNFNQGTLNVRVVSGADLFLSKPWGYSVGAHTMQDVGLLEVPNLNQFFYLWSVVPNAVGFGASAWVSGYRVPNGA